MSRLPNHLDRTAIEVLQSEHSPRLAELHAEAFRKGWSAEFFAEILKSPNGLGIGIFNSQDLLIGFCLCRWVIDEAEILTIVVHKSARKRGLGWLLLSESIKQLQQKGVNQVFLEVFERNEAALSLYHNLGFKPVGIRENYYIDTEQEVGNAIVLKLFLNK
jgi:ribosomal-protein-alanine N-acetyltransferase